MKNIIKKSCAMLVALTIIVSIVSATCNAGFAYDDETEIILPIWEKEEEDDNFIRP